MSHPIVLHNINQFFQSHTSFLFSAINNILIIIILKRKAASNTTFLFFINVLIIIVLKGKVVFHWKN
jgi:hypothetical protein